MLPIPTLPDSPFTLLQPASFLNQFEEGHQYLPLAAEVIEKLMSYDYPGHVRELRNILERAVILAAGSLITVDHIIIENDNDTAYRQEQPDTEVADLQIDDRLFIRRKQLDADQVIDALRRTAGHRKKADEILGVSERTLYRHIQKLKLDN